MKNKRDIVSPYITPLEGHSLIHIYIYILL